jgi:hypothetical protein
MMTGRRGEIEEIAQRAAATGHLRTALLISMAAECLTRAKVMVEAEAAHSDRAEALLADTPSGEMT